MAKATRSFVVFTALAYVASFCLPCRAAPPPLQEGQTIDPCSLSIGPVAGLTTRWHPAPRQTAIPTSQSVYFLLTKRVDGDVQWINALEIVEDRWGSVALCPLGFPHGVAVRARLFTDDGLAAERVCQLSIVPISPNEISVLNVQWAAADLGLSDPPTNEETRHAFYNESVAALTPTGPGAYATSVDRTVVAQIIISHPQFLPLMEWRVDDKPEAIGPVFRRSFPDIGVSRIEGGPVGNPGGADIQRYSATITMHSPDGYMHDDVPVTYTAVTDPPGFEQVVSWLASTSHGESHPVTGAGPEFTATFHDTFEQQEDGSSVQWLGVRGDNSKHAQRATSVCPLEFQYDGQDHVLVHQVFLLADPIFRIDLNPGAAGPVTIVAKDPGGADIPNSDVEITPGSTILYGVDNAQSYAVRTGVIPHGVGIVCAVQPAVVVNGVRSIANGCTTTNVAKVVSIQGVGTIAVTAEAKGPGGVDSSCPVTLKILRKRPGQADVEERSIVVKPGGPTVIEFRNDDASSTIVIEMRCPDGTGTCSVTITGRFFLPAPAGGAPATDERISLPSTTCDHLCSVDEFTLLTANDKRIYRVELTVPPPAAGGTACPVTVSAGAGGVGFPSTTIQPGRSTVIEIDNRAPTGKVIIQYSCPNQPNGRCKLTATVLSSLLASVTYPASTITTEACAAALNRAVIANTPGVYTFAVSVPATAPGGGTVCPVTMEVLRDGVVAETFTLNAGESATSIITNPLPTQGVKMITVTIRCTTSGTSTCNYTFTPSRQ